MRGRTKAGSAKSRRRKPAAPKRPSGTEAARPRSSSAAGQEGQIAQVKRELAQSRQEQIATADVLRIISSSSGSLGEVLETILENAVRICEAKFANLMLVQNNGFRMAAMHGAPAELQEAFAREPSLRPNSPAGTVFRTKAILHIPDVRADESYSTQRIATLGGARTLLTVPMLRAKELIGAIAIYRQVVRPFNDNQIELVQNFAAQAVIAIENARLLTELRESLDRQTATADILRVIASTPDDSKHALDTIAETASRMFGVANVNFRRVEGDVLRIVSSAGPTIERLRKALPDIPLEPTDPAVRCFLDNHQIPVEDRQAVLANERGAIAAALRELPVRSQVFTPLSRQGKAIGVMIVTRGEVRPFQEHELELMRSFADQAVIAIENARLLSELRQRTTDLSESLDQQTATSEVLKVISSAPGELNAVFDAILSNATRICEATYGNLLLRENGGLRRAAQCNAPQELIDEFQRNPVFVPLPNNPLDRVLKTKETVHTVDAQAESNLGPLANARTLLNVPMLSHGDLIGTISIYRREVRPFTEKQIALVQNFAAQAVIAIENARLLNELRDSLGRQTATSEVLSAISSSRGNLAPVHAILENATRICEATFGSMLLREGDAFRRAAIHNAPVQFEEYVKNVPILKRGMAPSVDHVTDTGQVSQTLDAAAEEPNAPIARYAGARTLLDVPLLKDNDTIGVLGIYRQEVRPFTDRQIELVKNFAAQAVIAIENARLLNDLNKLNQQLEQRVTDQVGEIERMGRLRRFLPPQVADLIVASGTEKQLESHRREITALFCDLRGFTGFSESSDPEDVMALLRDYHAAIGQIIIKYSGTLERYAGDGVMVVFNDPVPVENPALQAVLMALEMRDAIGALTETWRRWGHDISFGIGIAHGFATLGTIGFEGRFDYAAIGTVSNVASRLCDEAKPGQILIAPRVLTKVENAVTVEPVGEFALKGIRRPMMAYNVLSSSPSKPN